MRLWQRRPIDSFTVDDRGVRRLRRDQVVEEVDWANLEHVTLLTTDEGPTSDDVFWMLGTAAGTGVAIPQGAFPDGLLERLQELPGFDSNAVIEAMGSTTVAHFTCWTRPDP